MKKLVVIFLSFLLIGCSKDKITLEKDEYLAYKEKLANKSEFTDKENINFDIKIDITRVSEEEVSYRVIIDNPKENMHDVKGILIHNNFTDSVFPSIGIFDEPVDLLVNDTKVKGIDLVGYIETTKEIKDLNLELRLYIEYTNDNNEVVKIYYNSTN